MNPPLAPLAERMRPKSLSDFVGQEKLVGKGAIIRNFIENKQCPSLIFWGSPGVGKTTLSFLIANELGLPFYSLSAVQSGVKEVRDVISKYETEGKILLFIDEIHRFNKSQQDSLLKAVEEGKILLIGATTENPSFEVNRALLSRSKIYTLEDLGLDDLKKIADQALENDRWLLEKKVSISEWNLLAQYSGGDARKLLNIIELCAMNAKKTPVSITDEMVKTILQDHLSAYDKNGEMHYDIISAFIKSIRGSDPNAALYYLVRMIEGGEDPKFIARRLLILASEDISLANPNALLMANTCFDAVSKIGYPECSIILSQTVVYLATSPKSNSTYMALHEAMACNKTHPNLPVPLHLRNAPTKLMKDLNYGKDYKYAHNYEGNFVEQDFLPTEIQDKIFYHPGKNPRENEVLQWLKAKWKKYVK
jgi:putative ATPase